jgi:pimeloyl-ACP methyl ester carboxylesterase
MSVLYERFRVPVSGGEVMCGRWGTGDTVVLASHGITANHLSWQRVAELVVERSNDSVSLVAVDHRGRAGSADTPGPFGLRAHADDLVAILDHLDVATATLAGHSLGGFIIANAAEHHPDRVERLVLVDGGVPFPSTGPPPDPATVDVESRDVERIVQAVIGPALDRLDMRWPDEDGYVDFFRAHPAFQSPNEWTSGVEDYVRYDAVTTGEGETRSSVNKEAVLVDGGAAIVDPEAAAAIERVSLPTTWVWCPRGLLDQTPGLYPSDYVEVRAGELAHIAPVLAENTNHYTIVTADVGAGVVADAILAR